MNSCSLPFPVIIAAGGAARATIVRKSVINRRVKERLTKADDAIDGRASDAARKFQRNITQRAQRLSLTLRSSVNSYELLGKNPVTAGEERSSDRNMASVFR